VEWWVGAVGTPRAPCDGGSDAGLGSGGAQRGGGAHLRQARAGGRAHCAGGTREAPTSPRRCAGRSARGAWRRSRGTSCLPARRLPACPSVRPPIPAAPRCAAACRASRCYRPLAAGCWQLVAAPPLVAAAARPAPPSPALPFAIHARCAGGPGCGRHGLRWSDSAGSPQRSARTCCSPASVRAPREAPRSAPTMRTDTRVCVCVPPSHAGALAGSITIIEAARAGPT
jgi:hypothetical protein